MPFEDLGDGVLRRRWKGTGRFYAHVESPEKDGTFLREFVHREEAEAALARTRAAQVADALGKNIEQAARMPWGKLCALAEERSVELPADLRPTLAALLKTYKAAPKNATF